jgi:uncharacterized protein YggE
VKRKIILIALAAAFIFGAVWFAGCSAATTGTGVTNTQQQGIWVSGQGKVFATPNIANVSLGIQAQAATVSDAQKQAATAMTGVMAALTANGIDSKDIQTSNFNVQKVTRWDTTTNQEVTTGYMVTNTVNVKIRDVNKAGNVIDAVTTAGGDLTRVNNINFTIEDPLPFYDQARKQAVADAKARAAALAELAGVKLGAPVYITESAGQSSPPVAMFAKGVASDSSSVSTPISTGQLEIDLSVQINYAIK